MNILCKLAGHRPVPSNIWNDGYYFSRCSNCDCEMIGRGGEWRTVPRGYRIVWRPRPTDLDWKPWSGPTSEPGRLSDMLGCIGHAGFDDEDLETEMRSVPASVVESLHARSAAR
jgi:hypothetical protein